MGLIRNLLVKDYTLADLDKGIREVWVGGPTASGVNVSEQTSLRHLTVLSCVRVRSESFASLPLSVYRKRRSGHGRDEAYDHPLYDLIHAAPNPEMTSLTWRETMNGHLDLSGNCYAIITLNGRGQVAEVYPWDWHLIEPQRNPDTNRLEYRVNDRGKYIILPPEKVFHVPGFGFDGVRGYSLIQLAREAVGVGMAMSEFLARFYGQGMNVGTVLETEQHMEQTDLDDLRQRFIEKGSGLANSWMPLILHSGLKYNRIPMPLKDAQSLELMKLNQEQICGLFRVPPHLVANLDKATFSNIEHQSIEYVVFSMLSQITRFEQTMNWKFFTPAERAQGYYVKLNVDALLRGDYKSRQEGLAQQRQNGVINANEWREIEDINPIEGPAGEAYLVNGNMISTETAAQQLPKRTPTQNGGGEEIG